MVTRPSVRGTGLPRASPVRAFPAASANMAAAVRAVQAIPASECPSLVLPQRAIAALETHKTMQERERQAAGKSWQGTNLVFCHEDGSMYTADALN